MFLQLCLLPKSLQRAFVSPTEQRGLRCCTGKQNGLREQRAVKGGGYEQLNRALVSGPQTVAFLFSVLSVSAVTLSLTFASHPILGTRASSLQLLGQHACAESWFVALVCSHGLPECH